MPAFSWTAEADQEREIYQKYCSSCHGKDGRGNGSVSPFLKIKAPHLTLLRKK
jgi:mono/diheme cytochrome c family protein